MSNPTGTEKLITIGGRQIRLRMPPPRRAVGQGWGV